MTEADISLDNGPGINEREFISVLLKDYGDEVVCVAPYPQDPKNYYNVRIAYVFSHRGYNPVRYFIFLIASFAKIVSLHLRHRFNGVVFRLGEIPIIPILTSALLRVPVILKTLAGYTLFERQDRKWRHRLLSALVLSFYRRSVRCAAAADTVSCAYIEWLSFKFGLAREKMRLIPNGANTEHFSPRKCQDLRALTHGSFDTIVGYVGALDSLRHIDMLLRAAGEIRKKRNAAFLIVGGGAQEEELKAFAKKEGVLENVVFTGPVPYASVPEYISTFDIAVDLSLVPMRLDKNTVYASYSQKIPQYLSCAVPVIAWDIPDNQFLLANNLGGLVKLGHPESLISEIERILDMAQAQREELKVRAIEYAREHLSVGALTAQRIDFWRSVAKSNTKRE